MISTFNPGTYPSKPLLPCERVLKRFLASCCVRVLDPRWSPFSISQKMAMKPLRSMPAGIDLKGFIAIFWDMLKGDQRGSSTLTQQLAKNLFKTRSQGSRGLLGYVPGLNVLIIKAKEWMMAIQLEKAY